MAEHDEFLFLAGERTAVDAADVVVLVAAEVAGPKHEMIAVWKKDRPAVSILVLTIDQQIVGDGSRAAAIGS